jgi:translation initiation factor 1
MRAVTACVCKGASKPAHGDGIVRVSRETKGRAGKGVTLISGAPVNSDDLEKLAKQLKKRCGTGGTVKEAVIEIQGDHRDTLIAELTKLGFKVKRVGG